MSKEKVSFNYGTSMSGFFQEVQKTLVLQDDYRGMGGHGVEADQRHGTHSQTSIGTEAKTVNFREYKQ